MANTLTFANQTITDAHIFGGISFTHDLNTGEEFSIGNTASASVTFVTDIQLPLYTKDAVNGTFAWTRDSVSRGRFYITEVTKQQGKYTVTAYDAMILADTGISVLNLSFPLTVSALATAIATYLGCTVSGTVNNGSISVSSLDESLTVRRLLGYVAEASGCSVKIDGADHLCFMYYASSGITVPASEYLENGLEVADYTCAAIDNVTIFDAAGAVRATYGSGTNTLFIQGNPLLYEATNAEAQVIYSKVSGFNYAPLRCEMFEENGIEVGTIATFGTTPSLVMHLESSEMGAVASSVGSDSRAELNKSIEVKVNEAMAAATEAQEAVQSVNQHFWYTSSGTEAGAHIAEIPKESFEQNPSGSNLLAKSTGITLRDGTTDLATFSASGASIGKNSDSAVIDFCDGVAVIEGLRASDEQGFTMSTSTDDENVLPWIEIRADSTDNGITQYGTVTVAPGEVGLHSLTYEGSTEVDKSLYVGTTGVMVEGDVDITGQYMINGVPIGGGGSGSGIPYGACSTAAATVQKEVSISGVSSLKTGLTIAVRFANANSASNPTLKLNSLAAKAIKRYGSSAAGTGASSSWQAGSVITLTYDGTYWMMHDWNNTTYSTITDAEYKAGTSTSSRLVTPARLKAAILYHAPVTSVNGSTGAVTVQETLESGTNIKTINNQSILGSGNITISTGGSGADYIIEAGTSNGWLYRKWNSGLAECWKTVTITAQTNSSDAGGYVSASAADPGNFPFTFASVPNVQVTVSSGDITGSVTSVTRPTTQAAGTWKLYRNSSNTNTGNKDFMFYVIGTEEQQTGITNLIPLSEEVTSTAIFNNGLGYKNGYYISSGNESANANDCMTGCIPYVINGSQPTDVLYIKGYTAETNASHTRMCVRSASKTRVAEYNGFLSSNNIFDVEALGTGYYKLTPKANAHSSFADVGWLQFSFHQPDASGIIITKNEPIE